MTEIEAICPDCGVVHIPAGRWRLVVFPERPASSYCRFRCDCDRSVTLPATPRIIAALWYVVPSTMEHIPAEALERHDGAAFTEDDVLAFMRDLEELD